MTNNDQNEFYDGLRELIDDEVANLYEMLANPGKSGNGDEPLVLSVSQKELADHVYMMLLSTSQFMNAVKETPNRILLDFIIQTLHLVLEAGDEAGLPITILMSARLLAQHSGLDPDDPDVMYRIMRAKITVEFEDGSKIAADEEAEPDTADGPEILQ